MPLVSTAESDVVLFFSSLQGVSRQECDEVAKSLAGLPVNSCPVQGAWSYTVYAGLEQVKIVQFRAERLSQKLLKLAHSTFGEIVPECVYEGSVGNPSSLDIWTMDRVQGRTYIEARMRFDLSGQISEEMGAWLSTVVADFARFFARSWSHPVSLNQEEESSCRKMLKMDLDLLVTALPTRFTKSLSYLRENVDTLFSDAYPSSLTHADLCEMNILVDPQTGHISGIIDWVDATVQPFGLALWGLENLLGYMDSKGWHYFSNRKELEALFWSVFEKESGVKMFTDEIREKIHLARQVGIALRHGYCWDGVEGRKIVLTDEKSLQYLSAFLST